MVNKEIAGKGRFESLKTKYMQAAVEEGKEKEDETEIKKDPEKKKITEKASTIIDEVVKGADRSITKRRHSAYKGDRVTCTYKIPRILDEWMHLVLQEEGITISMQVAKGIKEWLSANYPDLNPEKK